MPWLTCFEMKKKLLTTILPCQKEIFFYFQYFVNVCMLLTKKHDKHKSSYCKLNCNQENASIIPEEKIPIKMHKYKKKKVQYAFDLALK